jgi:peptide-methionine (S)-S-oxide reductase
MKVIASLILVLATCVAWGATPQTAVFAGGCFWCMESDFSKVDGVIDVVSGFTGGTLENPTYNGDHTGHYEAVLVTYDPQLVSYRELLGYFWINIDPFDSRGQFCDKGPSYLSAIFVSDAAERQLAEESKLSVQQWFGGQEVATRILDRNTFYPVEEYHQDYAKKNPLRYSYYRSGCGRDRRLAELWYKKPDADEGGFLTAIASSLGRLIRDH